MRRGSSNRAWYLLIAALFVLAITWQAAFSVHVIRKLMNAQIQPVRPFFLAAATDRIVAADDASRRAGLRPGDELMAIQDRSYRGESQVSGMLSHMHPGETMTIRVKHPG